MKLCLTGFMGVGKTSVGRRVAELLGAAFVDLDDSIEQRAGLTVRQIFEQRGEAAFRQLERAALEEALAGPSSTGAVVVATGGGALVSAESQASVRELATVIWLDAPWVVIEHRLGEGAAAQRPLLGRMQEMRRLMEERRPAYEKAHLRVVVDAADSIEDVAERVVAVLQEARCATS